MYTKEIFTLLSWPISILITYWLISWALRKFKDLLETD